MSYDETVTIKVHGYTTPRSTPEEFHHEVVNVVDRSIQALGSTPRDIGPTYLVYTPSAPGMSDHPGSLVIDLTDTGLHPMEAPVIEVVRSQVREQGGTAVTLLSQGLSIVTDPDEADYLDGLDAEGIMEHVQAFSTPAITVITRTADGVFHSALKYTDGTEGRTYGAWEHTGFMESDPARTPPAEIREPDFGLYEGEGPQ